MDLWQLFQTILSLAFVLGLLLLTLWSIKYCQIKGIKNSFIKKLNKHNRIEVVETKRIDLKSTVSIIKCDEKEYVILHNASHNLLLDTLEDKTNA